MTECVYTVTVEPDVADLIPAFLENRRKEVEVLRAALAAGDFEQLRQTGHRMAGVGTPYGFDRVSALGRQIEERAKVGDRAALEAAVTEYADYLPRVKVVFR